MTADSPPTEPFHARHLTNDSVDVCKRSVERLYFPKETSYLRHFVKRPQRRSALSNRCYWLRLKVIDAIVRQFLVRQTSNGKKKIVIDLGCGSDVLPWRCHSRYPEACENALFIDVHNLAHLQEKRTAILNTPQLRKLLGIDPVVSEAEGSGNHIVLQSPNYYQVACDSSDTAQLQETLFSIFAQWPDTPDLLFVAEASLCRIKPCSSDALLSWASSLDNAEICLLEPIMPCGPHHPFANALKDTCGKDHECTCHADKYPTVKQQERRFESAGWLKVGVCDLWEAWEGKTIVSRSERLSLDQVELFDDWEDFMQWGRHHVLVHASSDARNTLLPNSADEKSPGKDLPRVRLYRQRHSRPIKRRFGAVAALQAVDGQHYGAHLFGSDLNKHLDTYDLYTVDSQGSSLPPGKLPVEGPSARACFTLTDLGDYGHLLVGGRRSSGRPCSDCWVLKKGASPIWEKVWDLPVPVFRHSIARIKGTSFALLLGGKTSASELLSEGLLFHPEKGWLACKFDEGPRQQPVFGASLVSFQYPAPGANQFEGLLFGGLHQDGTFNDQVECWSLWMTGQEAPRVQFSLLSRSDIEPNLRRLSVFGAQAVEKDRNVIVCGGIGVMRSSQGQAFTWLRYNTDGRYKVSELAYADGRDANLLPLLVGHSAIGNEGSVTLVGGGAVCPPNAKVWQTDSLSIRLEELHLVPSLRPKGPAAQYEYRQSPKVSPKGDKVSSIHSHKSTATVVAIRRVRLESPDEFQRLLHEGKPVVICGLDVGRCVERWTPSYMVGRVGDEQEVVAHQCHGTKVMDFNSKNFEYVTDTFANIMAKIEAGGRLYLRSLSNAKPSEMPANIEDDFPSLAQDFDLPEEIALVKENLFSSILRVSGRVNMWLHYDVMANVYTQIRGSKRMVLFPPSDVGQLAFAPGASSSSLDVFSALETPMLSQTNPHETHLQPGDILLLPPMWLHTATPTSDMSVAVNVFFRDLDKGYSDGRDVYGNRDLAAYEKARHDAARIGKSFDKLPLEIRKFYLTRIADELKAMAEEQ